MAAALVGAFDKLVPARGSFLARGFVRYLSGARASDAIGVRRLPWGGHIAFAAYMQINRLLVREEQHHPHFLNVTGRFQRDLLYGLVNHKQASFAIPDRLRDHWDLDGVARD